MPDTTYTGNVTVDEHGRCHFTLQGECGLDALKELGEFLKEVRITSGDADGSINPGPPPQCAILIDKCEERGLTE